MEESEQNKPVLIIDRSKWACGTRKGKSRLKNNKLLSSYDGKMCCLGFYLHNIVGIPKKHLRDKPSPEDVDIFTKKYSDHWLLEKRPHIPISPYKDSKTSYALINANDSSRSEREEVIAKMFGEKGVEVQFVGEFNEDTW